ncbi:alpha/beta fold hydrolase [Coralloluteibacterium stylophorae]|uniref:Alpha/beta hydrolase n=1 Tax=Coralloluteibacterium stylophorae TaxID=1776034 RepID=A0A8J7VSB7_9GAMM|nr:alpha/beta hydrolase [Coralloluteibacterium stylophorae]MBS7457309.1 alpha/beta hydrolase [Coralloluteibacterium stylophorae]
MRSLHAFVLLCVACLVPEARGDACADTSALADAREVVADLHRIVAPGGVQEAYAAEIGGIPQWLDVRGQDRANPVLLFVHGGPAAPVVPTLWQFQRPIEEYFTVVNWDQRGAGRTLGLSDPEHYADTLRIGRYVQDAIEVAEHVRRRYGKDKVVLMGHSWGTIVALRAALERPDLFHAYVGIGQVIDVRENERLSYGYGLAQARAHGNAEALRELASIAPYPGDAPITRERIVIARRWAQFYGGLSAFRETSGYYFDGPLLSPGYADRDRCAIDAGSLFTLQRVLPEFLEVDFGEVRALEVPVVMFMGRHDYTTPSAPTAAWLERLEAPYKRGVWFERSAHMIPWEEPGRMLVSLVELVRPLATDAPPAH